MLAVKLPDGSTRDYPKPVTGMDVAMGIGPGLAKNALAIKVNGELMDLNRPIETDAAIEIVTASHPDALELIRHDAAHVLAEAVKELYPEVQITIGPAIEDGFYYDIFRDHPFHLDDLARIEERMHAIVKRDEAITREVWNRDEAVEFFLKKGEKFKAEIIQDLPADQTITLYRQGDFIDLCRGPHLPSTGKLGGAFKLMKLAGAYWRGDSKNPMLQRIYGTAWATKDQLKAYLYRLEEAEKRDHRKLGKEMSLFHVQEEAVGSVFWHPKGWTLYRILEDYMRRRQEENGYVEVKTPQLVDRILWEQSGHWEKYRELMFVTEADNRFMALKPMNCPCHVQIFKHGLTSYKELPIRMAEFGSCHRHEPSGALSGIMRVRAFTQDDAHIFCREDQILEETKNFCDLLMSVYKDLGFTDVHVRFSDRPDVRAGTDETWDRAEKALMDATHAVGLEYTLNKGEGAFYGPKLEFVLKDALGRSWQCGTLQVDFVLPDRLGAEYVDDHGNRQIPVMLHRAILGSFERFIGVLIEHYAGKFPLWLAPQQIVITPITSDVDGYALKIQEEFKAVGLRADVDLRNEKVGYKIRQHSLAKVPVIVVVGKQEEAQSGVVLRRLGTDVQETLELTTAIDRLRTEASMPHGNAHI